jgi:hypothetical protein
MNPNSKSNGRVDILGPIGPAFGFADRIPLKPCVSYREALTGQWENNLLSCTFFSDGNIQSLQNQLIKGVYERSNGSFKIGEQDCDELKVIMRAIYLEHSKNLPTRIEDQINNLNKLVLNFAIDQVYKSAVSYMKYIRDVSILPDPLPHSISTIPVTNTLEQTPFF